MRTYFENTEVWGFEGAIRGMRNPKNSWDKSDSYYEPAKFCDNNFVIGDADMLLAKRLIAAGNEHSKFMRMIHVQTDVTCPRSIYQELDTYHFGVKNSCSTMHKLLNTDEIITTAPFDYETEDEDIMGIIATRLEELREAYMATDDSSEKNHLLVRAKMILPEGYLQKRTWDTNYAELRNIYFQRCFHRMSHWRAFMRWIQNLPYSELITYEKEKDDNG